MRIPSCICVCVLASFPLLAAGDLCFSVDDSPIQHHTYWCPDSSGPFEIGIYSTDQNPWSGTITSSADFIQGVSVNESKFPTSPPWPPQLDSEGIVTTIQEGYEYGMAAIGRPFQGEQFRATINPYQDPHSSYGTTLMLWDDARTFEVPSEILLVTEMYGNPGAIVEDVVEDTGGPYSIAPGQTVTFDGSGSYVVWREDDWEEPPLATLGDDTWTTPAGGSYFWSIDGVDVAFGMQASISYDTLVNGLNLDPGEYELSMRFSDYIMYSGSATTTITVLPEPAGLCFVLIGGMCLLRKR